MPALLSCLTSSDHLLRLCLGTQSRPDVGRSWSLLLGFHFFTLPKTMWQRRHFGFWGSFPSFWACGMLCPTASYLFGPVVSLFLPSMQTSSHPMSHQTSFRFCVASFTEHWFQGAASWWNGWTTKTSHKSQNTLSIWIKQMLRGLVVFSALILEEFHVNKKIQFMVPYDSNNCHHFFFFRSSQKHPS